MGNVKLGEKLETQKVKEFGAGRFKKIRHMTAACLHKQPTSKCLKSTDMSKNMSNNFHL